MCREVTSHGGGKVTIKLWLNIRFKLFLSKWFYDTFIDTTLEQPIVVHCWMGLGLSSSQLWRKHGGHEDLRDSEHLSVTPYVHGEDYCIIVCSSN
jgi:hypothetical protein